MVYRAREVEFDRWVAAKVLDVGLDRHQRTMFERECRAMGVVSQHPNIVTVLSAAFCADGRPAIVMELYERGSYAEWVRRFGALGTEEVLQVGIRICGALQSAHDRGLLHGDVKPQNLFVSQYGSRATAASDVYSLGATLYTLATGRRPFETGGSAEPLSQLALRIVRDAPPGLGGGRPAPLERAILAAMAKRPEDRPVSAVSFGRLLQAVQEEIGGGRTYRARGSGPH